MPLNQFDAMNDEENAMLRSGYRAPTSPVPSAMPLTQTGLSVLPSEQPQQQGSLTDFSAAMRAVSKAVYKDRQGKEGKVLKGQFDPSRVSGSIFKQIMSSVEAARGEGVSKMYGSAVDAAKFDLQQKEEQRQASVAQENKKFDVIKQKVELGIDSIYIPSGTLADRNNNPGNLRYVGQAGATQGEGGFARFNSPEDGFQALINQVQLDQSRGLTLQQFVNKYAPPSENNTSLYVQQISQWLGVDPNIQISAIDPQLLAENIAKKECGAQFVKASSSSTASGDEALAQQYKQGSITAAQIPAARRGAVLAIANGMVKQVSPEQKTIMMDNVALVDKLLNDEQYENISGKMQTGLIPFTEGKQTAKNYNQLKGMLALDKRQMLKGQGQISDFEFKVLGDAASNLTRWSSEEDFKSALQNIKGAFMTAAGLPAEVRVSKGGQMKVGPLTREEITDAIAQGFTVEYL